MPNASSAASLRAELDASGVHAPGLALGRETRAAARAAAVRAGGGGRRADPAGVPERGIAVEVGGAERPRLEDLPTARAFRREALGRRHGWDGTSAEQRAQL